MCENCAKNRLYDSVGAVFYILCVFFHIKTKWEKGQFASIWGAGWLGLLNLFGL
jgi:hypothetical protein